MRAHPFLNLTAFALLVLSLNAGAQQIKIEMHGAAATELDRRTAVAAAMDKEVGYPAAGMGQVVFFRSSKSPGDSIAVVADGASAGAVDSGTYLAVSASPGVHTYDPSALPINIKAGETKYVQIVRNRAGNPQLLRSTALKFQSAARQAK